MWLLFFQSKLSLFPNRICWCLHWTRINVSWIYFVLLLPIPTPTPNVSHLDSASLVQCSSVTKLCPTLWHQGLPGFPVLDHLLEFPQTHVHWVGDAIQTISASVSLFSCPRSFPAPGSFPMSFDSSHQVAKYVSVLASVLPMNIQGWFPLEWTGLISSLSRDDSGQCLPKIFVPKCFIHNFSVYLRAAPWGRHDLFI